MLELARAGIDPAAGLLQITMVKVEMTRAPAGGEDIW